MVCEDRRCQVLMIIVWTLIRTQPSTPSDYADTDTLLTE